MTIQSSAILYGANKGAVSNDISIPIIANSPPSPDITIFPIGKRCVTPTGEYVLTSFYYINRTKYSLWTLLQPAQGLQIVITGVTPNLALGTLTVNNSLILSTDILFYSAATANTTQGVYGSSIENGNFTILSTNSGDTSNFFYAVVRPS